MAKNVTVLVVGAGPVGLTAALALAQRDVPVRIVDAAHSVDTRMRASTFHPPTLDMIASLGLATKLIRQGLPAPRFQVRQHETMQNVTFDMDAIKDATAYPFRLQAEQHRYCALAINALDELGIDVKFDTRVEGCNQDDDGVTSVFRNGVIRARWLIGADGAASTVRKALGLDYAGKTYTHCSVVVSTRFPFHEYLPGIADVSYCWSERGPFSLLRLRDFWRASLYPGAEDLKAAANQNRVRDWLAYIHPAARDAEILNVCPYRTHERCIDHFRVGRVFLAGDAAHLNPPSGGVGMNAGIHDALNLSEKILQVLGGSDDKILDLYDKQRRTLAANHIIPQASANRALMATLDKTVQLERLSEQRAIASDPARNREFLLRASMITGLREAENIT